MLVGDPFTLTPAQIEANKSLPFPDQVHFNVDCLRDGAAAELDVGNFGNTPVGILRNPTWHQWDITLSRRFPVNAMGRKNSRAQAAGPGLQRVQRGAVHQHERDVHVHRHEQLAELNTNTGKYVQTGSGLAAGTIQPRVMGLTARFDW